MAARRTFGRTRVGGAALADLERIEAWTRERFALAATDIVLVSEQDNRLPGFPACETVITFWADAQVRYRYRVFKPARDVCEGDLPVRWLKPSLLDDGDADCC